MDRAATLRISSFVFDVAAALTAVSLPAHAQSRDDVVSLAPATNWNLDYAEDSCALRRLFGEEGQEVYLTLRQYGPSSGFDTTISSADFRRRSHMRGLEITYAPDSRPDDDFEPMGIEVEGFGDGVMVSTSLLPAHQRELSNDLQRSQQVALAVTDEARDAREAEIEGIEFSGLFRQPIFLETGSLHPAMTAMRSCVDELLNHWEIDVEAHRDLLRPVRSLDQENWVRPIIENYPSAMLNRGEQAMVRVRLNVSEEGRATACAVQSRINDETFDELACAMLLQHARFEPALDGDGNPIASFWQTAVIYRIS